MVFYLFNKKLYRIFLFTYSDLNKKLLTLRKRKQRKFREKKFVDSKFVKTCDELVHSLEVAVLVSKGIDPVPH